MTDHRKAIITALAGFEGLPLPEAARRFLDALGYASDRTIPVSSPADFCAQFDPEGRLDHPSALKTDWKSIHLLFQLTDDELARGATLFKDTSVNQGLLRSYLFFAIELTGRNYARTRLTGLTRQINRIFPMPVMVLIKHHTDGKPVLSIAVINRRPSKQDAAKDVLGKVTIIRDIVYGSPHRGHLDILDSFAFSNLIHPQRIPINNFDTLHAAWEEIFNVELLNKRFYEDLARWYFWALPQVQFPADLEPDEEKRNATSLIRLLTRLIFCWFLKEKQLIPEKLFNQAELEDILVDLDSDSCTYFQGILQNLFFATLNQRMGKDKAGNPYRAFAKDEGFPKNRKNHGVDNLYRYEEHFRDPNTVLTHFADVPFLNGGLFERLDPIDDETEKQRYLDGFTRNREKRAKVPNRLFFGEGELDISQVTGETRKGKVKALGLLRILHAYKFTIVENTPIDQEIALDPELLGKVFENLLASYNEETKTTARKQTGSFYTPRPIVEYMVDETLKAHLSGALVKTGMREKDAQAGLDILFAYTEKQHPFTKTEADTLLAAIHTCKILDPACGSGAFPMGMLQKLVYIIHKLDSDNSKWMQLQIEAAGQIPDSFARDAAIAAIERDFADNEDDYGRKLYLIENCLYGVDIQPIAIQISKLRFFISLVCDQKTNRNKKENHGVRPLPNLDTKFVAADTLIGLPEMDYSLLVDPRVHIIEAEIETLYHRHFSIQRRDQKLALQSKIKDLRKELGRLLAESLMAPKQAQHIADWDPFDPQTSSDFFDPPWMFGSSVAGGFDIVLGNPPYYFLSGKGSLVQKLIKEGHEDRAKKLNAYYEQVAGMLPNSSQGCRDYYKWFIDRGLTLTKKDGVLGYITPNTFLTLNRYADIRSLLFANTATSSQLIDLGFDVFAIPIVPSSIIVQCRGISGRKRPAIYYADLRQTDNVLSSVDELRNAYIENRTEVGFRNPSLLLFKHPLAEQLYTSPSRTGVDYFKAKEGEHGLDMSKAVGGERRAAGDVPVILDSELTRYLTCRQAFVPASACPHFDQELHSGPRMILRKTGDCIVCGFPPSASLSVAHQNVYVVKAHLEKLHYAVAAIMNSSVATFLYRCGVHGQKGRIMAQFRVHALEAIPFPHSVGEVASFTFRCLVSLWSSATSAQKSFLDDLIDACVMECYFRDHMAKRDLLLLDDLVPHLNSYNPVAGNTQQRDFLDHFYRTLNAPDSKIRNRLLRISADSPELLAVIKAEGRP